MEIHQILGLMGMEGMSVLEFLSTIIALVSLVTTIITVSGVYYSLKQKVDRVTERNEELEKKVNLFEVSIMKKLDTILQEIHNVNITLAKNKIE